MTITDRTGGLRHWVPRIAPAITTTTVLVAARAWNASGAEHAVGTAFLMGAFAAGSGYAGMVSASGKNGDPAITAVAFAGTGVFAMAGVAAYTDPLPLPILLWLIATIAVYAMCAKYWREDMRAEFHHLRSMERERQEHRHREKVTEIQVDGARDVAEAALKAAQLREAYEHRRILDVHPELAGLDIASKLLFGDAEAKEATERN